MLCLATRISDTVVERIANVVGFVCHRQTWQNCQVQTKQCVIELLRACVCIDKLNTVYYHKFTGCTKWNNPSSFFAAA